ncbi:MAG: GNAT family N-acetyltransferase [Lachnospiraceae bacterium]|nr:GNAT family N-acetyltransferase [Lachnospiraceae bacterium]
MICKIRKWELSDAADLAAALSNRKIQDNLRDGLPYPYTEQDGIEFISAMLSADENETFAYNAASCRVLEKAGFQYEDTLRSNAVKNGKVIDMKMYSLLKAGI